MARPSYPRCKERLPMEQEGQTMRNKSTEQLLAEKANLERTINSTSVRFGFQLLKKVAEIIKELERRKEGEYGKCENDPS